MTDFIESFATHQVLPPWSSAGVMTWAFVIRLAEANVQAYLDRYFNGAYPDRAPFAYSTLPGPQFGLLTVVWHPLMWSEYPGNPPGWDAVTVTEVYLGIPVHRRPISPDNIIVDDPTLVWVQPFMFGDNASVVFGSREIWGTDMEFATILREEPGPGQVHLDVAVEAIKTFSPRSASELLACLHLRANGFSQADLAGIIAASPDLEGFVQVLAGLGVFAGHQAAPTRADGMAGGAELNNLKQFRDVFDMGAAIYRAIVASETTHVNVGEIRFFDCEQVEIDFLWSDSLAEMLKDLLGFAGPTSPGPPPEHAAAPVPSNAPELPLAGPGQLIDWDLARASIKAELAFQLRSDVHFRVLKTLYTYGV